MLPDAGDFWDGCGTKNSTNPKNAGRISHTQRVGRSFQMQGIFGMGAELKMGVIMWNICGQKLSYGEKRQLILTPAQTEYGIPATLICGVHPGKTLVVTAQIHAGEYNGTPAVLRTAQEIDPEKLKAYVAEHPDAYQSEMAEVFGCSESGIQDALRRHKITRKKRGPATKSRTGKK